MNFNLDYRGSKAKKKDAALTEVVDSIVSTTSVPLRVTEDVQQHIKCAPMNAIMALKSCQLKSYNQCRTCGVHSTLRYGGALIDIGQHLLDNPSAPSTVKRVPKNAIATWRD